MKKIWIVLIALTLSVNLSAQTAANRTPKTLVSDALALMPARDTAEYNRLMGDLVASGEKGITMLTDMFSPTNSATNNAPVMYALSGWAAYVTTPGMEPERELLAGGLCRALQKSDDPLVGATLIRLLELCGAQESLPTLSSYLSDPTLGDPVRCAIASIRGEKLPTVEVKTPSKVAELYALVEREGAEALPQLLKAARGKDRAVRCGALNLALPYANKDFTDKLIALLPKAKGSERTDWINFLASAGAAQAIEAITPYIGSDDSELSIASIAAVTTLGAKGEATERIIAVLAEEQTPTHVRKEAQRNLLASQDEILAPLAEVVLKGSGEGQIAAIELLQARKAYRYAASIYDAVLSSDSAVSLSACKATGAVTSPALLPHLFTLLEGCSLQNLAAVQGSAVEALELLPEQERFALLKQACDRAGERACRYFSVMASTGHPEALELIEQGANSPDRFTQQEAIRGLLAWEGYESATKLREVIEKEQTSLFDEALRGYASRILGSPMSDELKQINLSEVLPYARNGAQRIALIEAMGQTNTIQALLTAGGYMESADEALRMAASYVVYDLVTNNADFYGEAVMALANRALSLNEDNSSDYAREPMLKAVARMPKEGGFVSLFNGTDLSGWKGLVENPITRAQMSAEELAQKQVEANRVMAQEWQVNDGVLTFVGAGYDNICTEKSYDDFEMYVDWMLYPDGANGDAGIYLRGTPQVQMWDIRRHDVGAEVGSGGLYNNQIGISTPLTVADNALGHWNTFHIKMVGDRVSVTLNGELVVDNVILENYWDRSQGVFPHEQIELQAHGTRVGYRNLLIKELAPVQLFTLCEQEQAEGFEVLFDGQNMHHWMGNTQDYIPVGGTITLYPNNGYGGNLYSKEEYSDFVLRFDFKLTEGANNGLGIRTPTEGDPAYVGMELQILDDNAAIYSELEQYQYHGSIYGVVPAKRGHLKEVGEWNTQEVIAKGDQITITLNGEVIVDANIREVSKGGNTTIDGKSHPGLLNPTGHIGFLGHGSEVSLRNIRIKEL